LIGHSVSNIDLPLEEWPPRSPDITPCDFFLWEYVKDQAFAPPLPQNLHELKECIVAVVSTADMIQKVWDELDYRTDV
jgi:hypothetical protein